MARRRVESRPQRYLNPLRWECASAYAISDLFFNSERTLCHLLSKRRSCRKERSPPHSARLPITNRAISTLSSVDHTNGRPRYLRANTKAPPTTTDNTEVICCAVRATGTCIEIFMASAEVSNEKPRAPTSTFSTIYASGTNNGDGVCATLVVRMPTHSVTSDAVNAIHTAMQILPKKMACVDKGVARRVSNVLRSRSPANVSAPMVAAMIAGNMAKSIITWPACCHMELFVAGTIIPHKATTMAVCTSTPYSECQS